MRSASLYRATGNCLMYAGLFWAIGIVLMPRGPMATLADLMALAGPGWVVSALLMIIGVVLGLAGTFGLYRHFAGGERQGWALLFLSSSLLGLILSLLANTVAGIGMPLLVGLAGRAPAPGAFEPAAATLLSLIAGLYNVDNALNALSFVPLGIAMLGDRAWPRWLGWSCLGYAALVFFAPMALIPREQLASAPGTSTPFRMALLLGFAFIVVLGLMVARLGRAPAPAPAAGEPSATSSD